MATEASDEVYLAEKIVDSGFGQVLILTNLKFWFYFHFDWNYLPRKLVLHSWTFYFLVWNKKQRPLFKGPPPTLTATTKIAEIEQNETESLRK